MGFVQPGVSVAARDPFGQSWAVSPFVTSLSGKREVGRLFSGSAETYGTSPDRTYSLWQPIQQQESLRKPQENVARRRTSQCCKLHCCVFRTDRPGPYSDSVSKTLSGNS